MAAMRGGDPWNVSAEERAKHDAQFLQLKPINGFVTGTQAKNFFVQSGLPGPVLGLIWALADLNGDGKMDKKEFSIAMHLIKKKLEGFELPKVLPGSLKADPVPTMGSLGMMPQGGTMPQGGMVPSVNMGGRMPNQAFPAAGGSGMIRPGFPMMPNGSFSGVSGGSPAMGMPQAATAPTNPNRAPTAVTIGEWAIPQPSKLRYSQMFNMHDNMRKGHLTGLEARAILTQTGVIHTLLAQIWNLSDIDNDGKLTSEEFVVCMHLVDMCRMGQPLPSKLPPELIPPSYRRGKVPGAATMPPPSLGFPAPGIQPAAAPAVLPPSGMPQQKDTFGDLLGGFGMSHGSASAAPPQEEPQEEAQVFQPVTFEDRRKANFDKGQAELDRRRQQLQEEQKKMQEERLAKDREEHEKRERIRMEQERKKQLEMERQMAKQREIEQKREEERRKALEQREAARRELERQRQLEWERQRKEQLIAERQREQNQVEAMQAEHGKLKLDHEALLSKKKDMSDKVNVARVNVSDYTAAIDNMRVTRDTKMAEMERYTHEIQELEQKLNALKQDKQHYQSQLQIQSNSVGDTYRTVMNSYESKKINIEKLKSEVGQMEKDTETKLAEIDKNNAQLSELNNTLNELQMDNSQLKKSLVSKQSEWKQGTPNAQLNINNADKKPTENGLFSAGFNAFESKSSSTTNQNDVWGNTANTDKSKDILGGISWSNTTTTNGTATAAEVKSSDAFGAFGSDSSKTTGVAATGGLDSLLNFGSTSSGDTSKSNSNWMSGLANLDWNKASSKSAAPAPPAATWTPKSDSKKAKALYQFEGTRSDEISLKPGESVWILADQSKAEVGWYHGERDGKEGFFPQDYVKMDEAQPASQDTSLFPSSQPSSQTNDTSAFAAFDTSDMKASNTTAVSSGGLLTANSQSLFTAVASAPSPTPGQGKAAPEGLQAQALYPWRAKKENHLTFDKGDNILVKEQQDMWWSGELNGKIGWFPKSYVKVLENQSSSIAGDKAVASDSEPAPTAAGGSFGAAPASTAPPIGGGTTDSTLSVGDQCVALYNYQSSEPGDLSFNQGDIIFVSKRDGDWWTGLLNERTGIFPGSYVKKAESQSAQKAIKKPEIASVIAPYQATGQEQLSLQPGQLIQVRKKSPSGWWEGELQARGQKRRIGWFPANYVKLLGTGSARSTPDSAGQRSSLSASPSKSMSPTPQPDGGSRSATPALPHPTAAPAVVQVVALYTYTAQHEDELSFHKGSVINVQNKDDANWWKGECNGATGMFPANYVQPLAAVADTPEMPVSVSWSNDPSVIANTSPTERKRQHHIHELINTEESYMKDLLGVIDLFQVPMKCILTEDEIDKIFVNWRELIICNTKLLKSLRVRKKVSSEGQVITMVGDILCENLPHMTPYIRFCSVQVKAAKLLQNKSEADNRFCELQKKCMMDRRTSGMPLSTFLLKPMQRITKYPLIISKILDYTPEDHPDHQYLQEALAKATEVCNQVNEGVTETDNTDKLEWIQRHVTCDGLPEKLIFNSVTNCLGPRKYMYSGTLYKTKSGKELVGFLFNDFLLLTQPQKSLGNAASVFSFDIKAETNFKMYRNPIFLNEIMTPIKAPTEEQENQIFHLSHVDKVYSLKAISSKERDNWVKNIEATSKCYLETERQKREKAHTARNELRSASIGRLLVVVVEGAELQADPVDGKSDPYCDVSMGAQEHKTKVIANTLNPKWNASMQFTIKDLEQDVLCITVFDRDLFTPNDFLGRTEVRIKDIYRESQQKKGPITKRLLLHEVEKGEVVVKLDLQLYQHS